MAYTLSWDETVPLGSAAANTIDDLFRALKRDLRERQADFFDLPAASAASYAADPLRPYGIKFTSAANSTIYLGAARSLLIKDSTGATTYLTQSATQLTLGSTIDFIIVATKKLYLDTGVDTYLYEISGNVIAFVANATNSVSINSTSIFFVAATGDNIQGNGAGTVKIQTGGADRLTLVSTTSTLASSLNVTGGDIILPAANRLRVDGSAAGDTYIQEESPNQILIAVGTNRGLTLSTTTFAVGAVMDLTIAATKKFYIDGGGDTYLIETSPNQVDLFAGSVNTFRSTTSTVTILSADLVIPNAKKLYLDGGSNTYIGENAAGDRIEFTAGGDTVAIFRSIALGNLFTLTGTAAATVFNVNTNGNVTIKATGTFYLDGGGDTYIIEASPNFFNAVCGSVTAFTLSSTDTQLLSSTTTASAANLRMASTGLQTLLVNTSLRKWKTNIQDITLEEARRLMFGLKPIFFNSLCNGDDPNTTHPGLIAEDVVGVDGRFATFHDGNLTSVYYERLAVPLYLIVKDHDSRLERLEKECLPGS